MISISIVVPVYKGEQYLKRLADEVATVRKSVDSDSSPIHIAELILVDDSAVDGSPEIIDEIAQQYDWVTPLHLSKNFGQHPATIAGILHTSGDWVATIDEDLQHPPHAILEMIGLIGKSSPDIVYGVPNSKVHQSLFRDLSSQTYKALMNKLIGISNINAISSFRLIRGPIARATASICGHDTYFDVALSWFSQRVETLRLELKDERYITTKKSGYGFRSLISHARRMAISGQIRLLRLSALLGIVMLMLGLIVGLAIILQKLLFPETIALQGWASLMVTVWFTAGLILFLLGLVLEYLSLLVLQAHGKPLYFTIDRSSDAELAKYTPPPLT